VTTETTTLTDWLLARVAEDEADAQRIPTEDGYAHHTNCWDKDRVLAECKAKRRIVERYAMGPCVEDSGEWGYVDGIKYALMELATVYADHTDYREEWRP